MYIQLIKNKSVQNEQFHKNYKHLSENYVKKLSKHTINLYLGTVKII